MERMPASSTAATLSETPIAEWGGLPEIGDVQDCLFPHCAAEQRARVESGWFTLQIGFEIGGNVAGAGEADDLAIGDEQGTKRRLAQPHRLFQHRIEHRRQIAGRGIDHLQHLGGRGLLLQRLALFGDQARIFHRDHSLRGEAFQQCDLMLGKRTGFVSERADEADQHAILAQRYREGVSLAGFVTAGKDFTIRRRYSNIRIVNEARAVNQRL